MPVILEYWVLVEVMEEQALFAITVNWSADPGVMADDGTKISCSHFVILSCLIQNRMTDAARLAVLYLGIAGGSPVVTRESVTSQLKESHTVYNSLSFFFLARSVFPGPSTMMTMTCVVPFSVVTQSNKCKGERFSSGRRGKQLISEIQDKKPVAVAIY